MTDLKLSIRNLLKTPFIASVAVLSLALGIGANAAIFSLFDQMILRPLPVKQPERLVNLSAPGPKPGSQSCGQAGDCESVFSYPMFRDLERARTGFSGLAAHVSFGANLAFSGTTVSGQGQLVSGSYFPVLGVQPALGRVFGPADDQTIGGHFVAVLSYSYWETRLGADRGVLNQKVVVNGHPMTIVGVSGRGFEGTTMGQIPDIFVPMTMRRTMSSYVGDFHENRRSYWAYLFGRLEPGVSLQQADAAINTVYRGIINDVEAQLQTGMSEQTMERFRAKKVILEEGSRGQSSLHGEVGTPLALLFATTGIVLLIACANIGNLLLARGAHRSQEMAVRGALGAGRGQLMKQLLTESCLLAVLGGLASLVVARWTLAIIVSILPDEAGALLGTELRLSVILFVAGLSIGTGLLFGMFPALHSTRSDLITVLRASTGQPSGARTAARFRAALVTAQIALSMALLFGAGLFIKSLMNVSRVDLGLNAENVVAFGLSPVLNGYESERTRALFERVEGELLAVPGVSGVSAALVPLLAGSNWGTDVSVEGWESGPDIDSNSRFNRVGAAYFSTLGMPLLAGREFTESDTLGSPGVVVVNEAFARKFGLDVRDTVGKWMSSDSDGDELDLLIVGLVQDAKYSQVKQEIPPLFFTPYRQDENLRSMNFYVRTSLDTGSVARVIPEIVRRLDPNLPVENLKTLEQQVSEDISLDRLISSLSAAFAILATLLAAIGLYGVLAYTVAQRTREIGLRMALGADGPRVRAMVLRQVAGLTLTGGAIGIVAALGLGRAAQSLLFGMEGHDPAVAAIVVLLLVTVAFGAGYVPAFRASRVDPMHALRYE